MNDEFLAIFPIHRLKNQQFKKTAAFEQEGIICYETPFLSKSLQLGRVKIVHVAASLEARS